MNRDSISLLRLFSKISGILARGKPKGEYLKPVISPLRAELCEKIKKGLFKGKEGLIQMEKAGIQGVPFNFYSPIPSVSDIENGWESQTLHPFFEPEIYDNNAMMDFLLSSLMPYAGEFHPSVDPSGGESKDSVSKYYWNNTQFSHSDALSLYCFIRHLKPKTILEIGGGFSTLIINQAIKMNGFGEIWEVEPYPRPFLRTLPTITKFFNNRIEELPLTLFDALQPNDILFIDSTHTVKTSSDCIYIYLKGLKRLKKGVFIHSHDIFLPDSFPKTWNLDFHFYWTEQYLLQALLLDNSTFKVIFGSHYHNTYNKDLLDRFMDGKANAGGGSFWYVKR